MEPDATQMPRRGLSFGNVLGVPSLRLRGLVCRDFCRGWIVPEFFTGCTSRGRAASGVVKQSQPKNSHQSPFKLIPCCTMTVDVNQSEHALKIYTCL